MSNAVTISGHNGSHFSGPESLVNLIARALFAAVWLLVVTLPAAAQTVVHARRLPSATLLELAAGPAIERSGGEVRHEKRHRKTPTRFESTATQRPVPRAATLEPPPVTGGFRAASSGRFSPADASGAVGPNHVVGAFNSGILVQNRSGATLAQLSLEQFWLEASNDSTYDPRIAYDAQFDRWVTIAIKDEHSLMIAASATGDPTGQWLRYALKIDATGGNPIDFSRLALTRDTIVAVTERIEYASCLVISTQKSALYAGGATVPLEVYDTRGSASQVVPVSSDDSDVEYLLTAHDVGAVAVKRLDVFQWQNIASRFTWEPGWHQVRQRDTDIRLDFGFDEIHDAELRRGTIHAVQMIGIPGAEGRTAILWWKINPVALAIVDQGVIDDGHSNYGFPSVAVNRTGGMLIAYSTTSGLEYPSAHYVYVDATGNTSTEGTVKSGVTAIRNTDRWGDYTTTVLDPADDKTFWTVQIYANNVWETWWARVKSPDASRRRAVRH